MNSIRILHMIASMDPEMGGLCKAVRMIITGLEDLSACNEVVSTDAPDAAYLASDPFPIHALGPGKTSWCFSDKLVPWLLNNFYRFDIVILHGLWVYNGYAVNKAIRLLKNNNIIPSIFVMPHGMLDPYFQRATDRKLKALRNWVYWKLIERHTVNQAMGIFFTCEEEKRLARQPFRPYAPKREFVVGLGIEEPPCYNPKMRNAFQEKCPDLGNHSYLLFISRIHPKKGVDLLIKAYSELYNKAKTQLSPENDGTISYEKITLPKLVVAGPNIESVYGQQMQELVSRSIDVQNMVYFPGMLSGDAKWGALYGCEAFVLASHQENFGIAVVEALACSRPVIISNEINIWKEIMESGAGIINDDTLEGTSKSVNYWIQLSEQQKDTMGKNARDAFEKHFAIAPVTKRLKEILYFSQAESKSHL